VIPNSIGNHEVLIEDNRNANVLNFPPARE